MLKYYGLIRIRNKSFRIPNPDIMAQQDCHFNSTEYVTVYNF